MTTAPTPVRSFLSFADVTRDDLHRLLALAREPASPVLADRSVVLIFEKDSLRTLASTQAAVAQLGGAAITFASGQAGLDEREPAEDIGRVLGSYSRLIAARVGEHSLLDRLANCSGVPIVNLLSDDGHPCQTLADLLTVEDEFGSLRGLTVAWVGDGNNVCASLIEAAPLAGYHVRVATPRGYEPRVPRAAEPYVHLMREPWVAVGGADVIYTDTWISMGQELEAEERLEAFRGFTVTVALLEAANANAIFLHCLPAHRGMEVASEVIDGRRSRVWVQARHRLAATRSVMTWLCEESEGR